MQEEERRTHPYLVQKRYEELTKKYQEAIDKELDFYRNSIARLIVTKIQLATIAKQQKALHLRDVVGIALETFSQLKEQLSDAYIMAEVIEIVDGYLQDMSKEVEERKKKKKEKEKK